MLPLITHPTRFEGSKASLLDLICCSNLSNNYESGILVSSVSDHLPVFLVHDIVTPLIPDKVVTSRMYTEENSCRFTELVTKTNWETFFTTDNTDKCAQILINNLTDCHEQACPPKTIKVNKRFNPLQP